MPHKAILKEVYAMKSLRDRHTKDGRWWSRLNKKIRRLQAKANRVANNSVKQAVAKVVGGADRVSLRGYPPRG